MRGWVRGRWHARDDAGNVSVLTLGWIVLALVALLGMAVASQVHVDRMRLASLADEAALAAVQSTDVYGYFASGADGKGSGASHAAMWAGAHNWLAEDPRPWVSEVAVLAVSSNPDGTVTVELGRTVMPLFELAQLGPLKAGVDLTVEGRARVG